MSVRLAEVMACLSVAADLGMGQPSDYAMTTCIVGMRLGGALGFDDETLQDVYYETLLRYVGCNAETYWLASVVGDELAFRAEFAKIDAADTAAVLRLVLRFIRKTVVGQGTLKAAQAIIGGLGELSQTNTSFLPGHCEVARRLASRMGFGARFTETVGQIYARFDGKGVPPLKGEAIAPALLCASLAHDAVIFHRLGGITSATAMARSRRGSAHAPQMVDVFCAHANAMCRGLHQPPLWNEILALEPGERRLLDDAALDTAFDAIADFSDLKSPWFLGHSRAVAALAARASAAYGLAPDEGRMVRRAALVHDIGKVGVSAAIWGKVGPLTDREWDVVRLHPYHTGRVFARSMPLTPIGALASLHHERLDGSGYHRSLPAAMQPAPARVLAAANRFRSLMEPRPHRTAFTADRAAQQLRADAREGGLEEDAVRAVLTAAGEHTAAARLPESSNLSPREIEVLRLLARGQTMKTVAGSLGVSYKTVDRHVQNIYTKIGVNTRAGATLWALEHGLN
jgi:HD-GYP domain-containing protein (c-di-GMP phosphodiesterase class II)